MKNSSALTRIFGASFRLALVVLVARGISAVKDVALSRAFGTSADLDTFLVAFGIMSYVGSAISGACLSTVVPAVMKARSDPRPELEHEVTFVALIAVVCVSSLASLMIIATRGIVVPWIVPGFSADKVALVRRLVVDLAPVPILAAGQSVLSGTLNSRFGFRGAAAVTALTPLCVAALLLLSSQPTVQGLAGATDLGMVSEFIALGCLARRARVPLAIHISLAPALAHLRSLAHDFLPLVAGTALNSTSPLIDQAFASSAGEGAIAIMNYGNRFTGLAMGFGVTSIGLVVLPHFSELAARRAWDDLLKLFWRVSAATLLLAIPVVGMLIALSEPLTRLLFQRGHFVERDTIAVAAVQSCYALQIPFHLTGIVAIRVLNAMGQTRAIMAMVLVNVSANFVGDYVLVHLYGVRGIALASSAMFLIACGGSMALAAAELNRRIRADRPPL